MLTNFFGKRGSGKTNVITGQLEYLEGPVVVLDLLGNFTNPDWVQLDKISHGIEYAEYYKEKGVEENLQKIMVLQTADPDMSVDYMSAALWEIEGGTLVLDEADGFSFTNAPCFDQLVRYGRNKNVDLVTGCRRPAEISRNITAGANKIFCFQTQEPRDIDYFKNTILGELAEKLIILPKYSGLYVDYDEHTVGGYLVDANGKIFQACVYSKF